MNAAADRLRSGGVGVVYLCHGTFAGTDAAGLLVELGRFFPAARQSLGKIAKGLIDAVVRDNGNYTADFARTFEEALNRGEGPRIEVRLFPWTGENHHLGRADAAVRLIEELAAVELPPGRRILLWGHSHAGNVFALLSQLVGGDEAAVDAFFRAAECHYRVPWIGVCDIPVWQAVEQLLRTGTRPIVKHPLDVVTFGTPIRYGWDAHGYAKLLHFIHHRPQAGADADRAAMPRAVDDVLRAVGGDYVQQFGIAGTNTPPNPIAFRALRADRRLNELLQPAEYSTLNVCARVRLGCRVPDSGETLLVDYGPPTGNIAAHLAGHAVYTKLEWLPFHVDEVARRFYGVVA